MTMANEDSNKFSSNLKVPPLKIVLSSHQNNNAVVNITSSSTGSLDESAQQTRFNKSSSDNNDSSSDHFVEHKDLASRRGSLTSDINDACEKHHSKKNSKGSSSSDRNHDGESGQAFIRTTAGFSSSSSTSSNSSSSSSSSSERSNSTTPSSESESLASTSTIISEHHQQQHAKQAKQNHKDDATPVGKERSSSSRSYAVKASSSSGTPAKRSQDSDQQTNPTNGDSNNTVSSKEQTLNANQRITRSSQRAAQQSKVENPIETNGDEPTVPESQPDKTHESARKVKRRKGEPQESEQDTAQSAAQPAVIMANIYPADYQLPSQNSFELYRDIRKQPHKKLMKLGHVQPKVPHGFKDYLLSGGPYLLDGNKLGVGLNGARLDNLINSDQAKNNGKNNSTPCRAPFHNMKLSNLQQQKLSSYYQSSYQRHTSYTIPKILDAPKNLQPGSPLYELFQDQERARYQMRIQHLKERERSILASEQEILRVYNNAAIADVRQKRHLSACTYFYYQERYHYLDDKSRGNNGDAASKEVPHCQDNSNLCIEGGEAAAKSTSETGTETQRDSKISSTDNESKFSIKEEISSKLQVDNGSLEGSGPQVKRERGYSESSSFGMEFKTDDVETTGNQSIKPAQVNLQKQQPGANGDPKTNLNYSGTSDNVSTPNANTTTTTAKSKDFTDNSVQAKDGENGESLDKMNDEVKNLDHDSDNTISESTNGKDDHTKDMPDEDFKNLNKKIFLNQLQEIDDKWDKIKKEMLIRHKNEADSLYAIQLLEWEWKAKEIGACDVRVSLEVEPEFVPRVEVVALDY